MSIVALETKAKYAEFDGSRLDCRIRFSCFDGYPYAVIAHSAEAAVARSWQT